MAVRSGRAIIALEQAGILARHIVTDAAVHNAMVVHAAFGGSTNLLLHVPAIAHAAGLRRPVVDDWDRINRQVPRIVDVLPNGPQQHVTVRAFLAGGVPEVMLHLRAMGLLQLDAMTATGRPLGDNLDWWERSDRRGRFRQILKQQDGVDADEVIMGPDVARARGMTSTVCFPTGNLAPEGSVVKATAIAADMLDEDGVYTQRGPARVFTSEKSAMAAIKADRIRAGDVMVLLSIGPMGTGMEEIAQVTIALKYCEFGKDVALLTDARFSGFSSGPCIGHLGPEALAGGPVGRLLEGDVIEVMVDTRNLRGRIDLVGHGDRSFDADEGARVLAAREPRPDLAPDEDLPDDTRLWAALQRAGGGTWGGCVYDVDEIIKLLDAGRDALDGETSGE
jgi:putative YjhG/YagF family dehydratase